MAYLGDLALEGLDTSPAFPVLPGGEYALAVVASDVVAGKLAGNSRLNLTIEVMAGEHKGAKVFSGLNIVYSSPDERTPGTTQTIARKHLAKLCDVTGTARNEKDSEKMHNKVFKGKIKLVPPSGEYKARNDVDFDSFEPLKSGPVGSSAPVAAPVYQASAPIASAPDVIPF